MRRRTRRRRPLITKGVLSRNELDWDVVASSAIATSRHFEVEVNGAYVDDADYIYGTSEVSYIFEDPTPLHAHQIGVRERADAGSETEFSGWAEASEFCDRFVPQEVTASYNSHGVLTIGWKAVRGSANYDIVGPNFPDGVGDRTEIHVQRNEGETYEFQVEAHTAGDWGDPSDTATAECDPLDASAPGYPGW